MLLYLKTLAFRLFQLATAFCIVAIYCFGAVVAYFEFDPSAAAAHINGKYFLALCAAVLAEFAVVLAYEPPSSDSGFSFVRN